MNELLLLSLLVLILIPQSCQEEHELHPLLIRGYKFFDAETGIEVVFRGIDYFPRPNYGNQSNPAENLNQNSVDLYTDEHRHIWERDIVYLKELNVNAIRLYAVDPDLDHSSFMCALNAAGIYVLVALAHDCPTCAITRDAAPECYPAELKIQGQKIINEFSRYTNTLAFSAGNEVNHFAPVHRPQWNGPCQKKFIADMRNYIHSCQPSVRHVPVGLVSADSEREELVQFYNCVPDGKEEDTLQTAEWYGLNTYVFCNGNITRYRDARGFRALEKSFKSFNYSIPVLLTEFGCLSDSFKNQGRYEHQRNFLQAKWLLEKKELRDLFSGGFAFEYSMEMENAKSASPYPFTTFGKQNYGVGYFSPEKCDDIHVPCHYHPLPSFYALQDAYETKTVDPVHIDSFQIPSHRVQRSTCPDGYPSLRDFEWKTDKVQLKCPFRLFHQNEPNIFTCPTKTGFTRGRVSPTRYSLCLLCILLAIALVTSLVALAYTWQRNKEMVIFVPQVLSESKSMSTESVGLLSMQNAQYNSIEN